jgi:hypothetical protein
MGNFKGEGRLEPEKFGNSWSKILNTLPYNISKPLKETRYGKLTFPGTLTIIRRQA